jgi:tRNA(Ile)-lysidine synthase TilS/MesJ/sulfur carrier protein ThiS
LPAVVFYNKGGQSESLIAAPGMTVRELLRNHGIPANAVLTWINGTIVAEQAAVVGPDDHVEIRQVRHYDLDVTRRPAVRVLPSASPPVYAKSVLFDTSGQLEVQTEQMDAGQFVDYIEGIFASSVTEHGLLAADAVAVVGLSGGRDSVAFLKLLERCTDRIGRFPLTAVTVTGLPDWEEPATFEAARAVAEALGVEQVLVDADAIKETFHLRRGFHEVMQDVVGGQSRQLVMVITHHVMRRMVEIEGVGRGAGTVALGLNADDLFATIVTWLTSGFTMGGIPSRTIGELRYVFPLFRITKKELTLYLELVAPELNRQGTPGRFTTGPGERSMAYAITDHLYDLWPGIDYYVFEAYQALSKRMVLDAHDECRTCGAAYLPQPGTHNPKALCDVCHFFAMNEYAVVQA